MTGILARVTRVDSGHCSRITVSERRNQGDGHVYLRPETTDWCQELSFVS